MDVSEALFKGLCAENHQYILQYFEQFINSYKNQPKFSLNWMIDIAHNLLDNLFHTDKQFLEVFECSKEKVCTNHRTLNIDFMFSCPTHF